MLIAMMVLSVFPVSAAELPNSFWPLNDNYMAAVEAKNYPDIAKYAEETIDMISKLPEDEQTSNIIGSRAYEAAFAHYFLGNYEASYKYFDMYIPYGIKNNWADGVKIAKEFAGQLAPALEIYKYTPEEQVYFGAKDEPHGVLYGQVSEKIQPHDSMVLLYLEYGNLDEFAWARHIFSQAEKEGLAVELALNFQQEGDTARSITENDAYLSELYSLVSEYTEIDIFLRIGSEMNVWNNMATPEEFINAFRIISRKMGTLVNVATVWSISHTSGWDVNTHDFYPGDDYVDWVGLAVYPNKYFAGQHWSGIDVLNEVCFKTGYNADPILMVKDMIDTYGDRKPVMISECGSAYRTNGEINEYHHEWAADYLEKMYSFIPMVYPQVKLMAYFNKNISYEQNYYDLDGSSELKAAYEMSVLAPQFIKDDFHNSAEIYFEKINDVITTDGDFKLGSYMHIYGADNVTVNYYIDDKLYASTSTLPYEAEFKDIAGTKKLRVEAIGDNGAKQERTYTIKSSVMPELAELFSDVGSLNDSQKQAVEYAYKNGITTGYEDGTFRPLGEITRAEFATMVCRLMGYEMDGPCAFDDAKSHWGSQYINACVKAGAINGVGNNMFAPDDKITFEQAVKIVSVVSGIADGNEEYPDGFIAKAIEKSMLDNLTATERGKTLSRIDAAVMMYNAVK